jgi:superoxide dismutase, Fe-Mn family
MNHTIQKPQYELNALEPYFDAATMDLHLNKHHQGYADKLNALLETNTNHADLSLEELIKSDVLPIKNMAGGVLNHNFFWTILSPEVDQSIPEPLQAAINDAFGSKQGFVDEFTNSATSLFGSGWTWLTHSPSGLEIINLPNQDNPKAQNKTPILGIDLWEHAYYLKYQNRRPEYIQAFWHVVDWQNANHYFTATQS